MKNLILTISSIILLFTLIVLFSSCGKQEKILSTGKTLSSIQINSIMPGHIGDSNYAVVNSQSLQSFYDNLSSILSEQGLVKWDSRFDCNHFSSLYIALAQSKWAVAAWNSNTPAQSLALAEIWYNRGGVKNNGHAIVLAVTENGPIYIEPQTGQQIILSEVEVNSIYFCRW
jgi:hypothetical protein